MADEWDELEKSMGLTPSTTAPETDDWDEFDKQATRRVKEPNTTFPQYEVKPVEAVKDSDFAGSTLQIGPLDTRIPIPASVGKGLAQIGAGFADAGLGYRQLFGNATREEADEKKRMDAPLTKGVAGTLNNIVGKVAPFMAMPYGVSAGAMRGAGPILEGLGQGAMQGALEPVGKKDSRAANIGLGSVGGAMLPAMMAGARHAARPADEANQQLVESARREGIPLGIADTTSNKLLKAFRSFANDLPFTGSSNAAQREAQQEAFNFAAGRRWGSTSTKHTNDSLTGDKRRIGAVMDRVWGSNDMPYDANLFGTLRQYEHQASLMPEAEGAAVMRRIADIEDKVVAMPNGDLRIPGDVVNSMQKDLFKKFGAAGDERAQVMMGLRGDLLDHFNRNVADPRDAAALTEARSQWKALKAVEAGLNKSEVGMAQRVAGDIRPIDLSGGVAQIYRNAADTPYGDLPQIGQQFLRDTTAQTGGSPRAFIQNNASLLGVGALGGVGWLANPLLAATTAGGFMGANKALSSPAVRRLVANDAPQRLLSDAPNANAATMEMLANAFKRAPVAGALALGSSLSGAEEAPRIEVRGTSRDRDDEKEKSGSSPLASTNK